MALVLSKGGMGKGPRHGGGGNNDGSNDGPNDDLTELQEKHNEIDELGNEFIDKMEEILAVRKEIESLGDDSASKEFLLNRINELEENTKNQYTREVSEKQEELQEKMTEIQKNYEKQADDNKKIAEKLENITSDKIDLSEVADVSKEARDKETEQDVIAEEIRKEVERRQQFADMQVRRMRIDRLK